MQAALTLATCSVALFACKGRQPAEPPSAPAPVVAPAQPPDVAFYVAMVSSDDDAAVQEGRPVTPEVAQALRELAPKLTSCHHKQNLLLLVPDSIDPASRRASLDYLSCPPDGDLADIAHAVALAQVNDVYDRQTRYAQNRYLLWRDVNQVLAANGQPIHDLALLDPPAPTVTLAGTPIDRLIEAAETGNLGELQRAIKDGAELDARDRHGNTALILAFIFGHFHAADLLIRAGADVRAVRTKDIEQGSESVLYFAADRANRAWIDRLVAAGADPRVGDSPLVAAIKSSNLEALEALLAHGARVKPHLVELIEAATRGAAPEMVARVLDLGADPNTRFADGDTPLISTVADAEVVAVLLARGAKVDARRTKRTIEWNAPSITPPRVGMTALAEAAAGGHIESVRRLLEAGADPNLVIPGYRYEYESEFSDAHTLDRAPDQTIREIAATSPRADELRAVFEQYSASHR